MVAVNFTTREKVKLRRGLTGVELDPIIDDLIAEVSDFGEGYLQRHTLSEQRTSEIYILEAGKRYIWLRGFPLTSVTTVKYSASRSFATVDALPIDSYEALAETGELHLLREAFSYWHAPGFVEISYRGGMAVDTAAFMVAYPAISGGATAEVINRLNRRMSPEGNLRTLDTGLAFEKPVEVLKVFKEALDSRRRILL